MVGGRFSGNIGSFGLYGGELSSKYIKALYAHGPGHSIPPISVHGPLPRFASTRPFNSNSNISSSSSSSSSSSKGGKSGKRKKKLSPLFSSHFSLPPTTLPVIFWYDARHVSDKSIGYKKYKN